MRRDIFEDNYKGNAVKVLFIDLVIFLLVTILSVGFCYSYFSDKVDATGNATTANVDVVYRKVYNDANPYNVIYGKVGLTGAEKDITDSNIALTPGDTLYITGYAVNTSNVAVYVLAKLEVTIVEDKTEGEDVTTTEVYWYNIDNNTIVDSAINGAYASPTVRYTAGASSLEAYDGKFERSDFYKHLSIPYKYDGSTHTNLHTVTGIKLTLHVHQKDYLRQADDFAKYSNGEQNGKIGTYATESIYAAHQMTGRTL